MIKLGLSIEDDKIDEEMPELIVIIIFFIKVFYRKKMLQRKVKNKAIRWKKLIENNFILKFNYYFSLNLNFIHIIIILIF